jgi:hypothetical protein
MNALVSGSILVASMFVAQAESPRIVVKDAVPTPLAGQVAPAPGVGPQQQPMQRPILGWFSQSERPLISRWQKWWKGDDRRDPVPNNFPGKDGVIREPAPVGPAPLAPGTNDFPRKLPNSTSQGTTAKPEGAKAEASKPVQQTALREQPAATAKSPILPQFANKMGRDEKFEWITGQLEIENGNHVIYYATPETVDKFHGRIVVLAQKDELKQLSRGDLISVRGTLTQRQTLQGSVPIYRLTDANLIERPKQ